MTTGLTQISLSQTQNPTDSPSAISSSTWGSTSTDTLGSTTSTYTATSSAFASLAGSTIQRVTSVWNFATYPAYALWTVFSAFRLVYLVTYPVRYVVEKIIDAIDAIWYRTQFSYAPRPVLFPQAEIEQMRQRWFTLGSDKWREGVDGIYQHFGKRVFDEGLHAGTMEPGFIRNWERAAYYASFRLGEKMTPDLYLDFHQRLCAHFIGINGVLMGQEQVGVFRGADSNIMWYPGGPNYLVSQEAIDELNALNSRLGFTISTFDPPDANGKRKHWFTAYPRERVGEIMQIFFNEFYEEIARAQNPDDKLIAIARLVQHLEWLHPPRDGSGRTNWMVLNFLLVEYGFHPVILDRPYKSDVLGFNAWLQYLHEGLAKWEQMRSTVEAGQQINTNPQQ